MKKIYLVFVLAVAVLASCNTKKSEGSSSAEAAKTTAAVETKAPDTHNAQNALDVDGTYEGKLPAASGGGMKVVITLNKDTYKKSVTYDKDTSKTFDTTGKFSWDKSGSIITLETETVPNKYFVGENKLTQLDTQGNKVTGPNADLYVLTKK